MNKSYVTFLIYKYKNHEIVLALNAIGWQKFVVTLTNFFKSCNLQLIFFSHMHCSLAKALIPLLKNDWVKTNSLFSPLILILLYRFLKNKSKSSWKAIWLFN